MLAPYCPGLDARRLSESLAVHGSADDRLLTKREACGLLRVSARTLDRMLNAPASGLDRVHLPSGSVRVRESAVLALVHGRRGACCAEAAA